MQIVLKRIAKKKTYTIGRLYILKDEDVKKRTIESVNKCRDLKFIFTYADSFKTYSEEEDLHDRSPLHPEG